MYSSCLEQKQKNSQIPYPKHLLKTKHLPSACRILVLLLSKRPTAVALVFLEKSQDTCIPRAFRVEPESWNERKQSFIPNQKGNVWLVGTFQEQKKWVDKRRTTAPQENTEILAKSVLFWEEYKSIKDPENVLPVWYGPHTQPHKSTCPQDPRPSATAPALLTWPTPQPRQQPFFLKHKRI